jgi:hypothetical protein
MYSSFVTLLIADFCGPGKSTCLFVCFPGLTVVALQFSAQADSVLSQ